MIKNINIGSTKPLGAVSYFNQLGSKTKNVYNKLIDEQDSINNKDLVCVKTDGTIYGFTTFKDQSSLLQIFIKMVQQVVQKIFKTKCLLR